MEKAMTCDQKVMMVFMVPAKIPMLKGCLRVSPNSPSLRVLAGRASQKPRRGEHSFPDLTGQPRFRSAPLSTRRILRLRHLLPPVGLCRLEHRVADVLGFQRVAESWVGGFP